MQVGQVAHEAYGQGNIEPGRRVRLLQLPHALVPAGSVVILGVQSATVGLAKRVDDSFRLRGGLAALRPGELIAAGVVEGLHVLAVIRKVRPAQIWQAPGGGDVA